MNLTTFIEEGNFQRPSAEIALDLIYIANQYRVPVTRVEFGIPEALDQRPDVSTDANTFVTVKIDPLFDDRFRGDTGFMYQRLDLSVLTDNPDVVLIAPEFPFEMHQLLPALNLKFGTMFSEADIRNDTITGEEQDVTLIAAETSLVWLGSRPITVGGIGNLTGVRVTTTGRVRITSTGSVRVILPTVP